METAQTGKSLRVVYKKLNTTIDAANKTIKTDLTLEKDIVKVTGIALSTNNEDGIQTLTNRLEINGVEIFPQEFESKMIYCYATVEGDKRFFNLDQPSGNGVVKIACIDTKANNFTAYNINFYLRCLQVG